MMMTIRSNPRDLIKVTSIETTYSDGSMTTTPYMYQWNKCSICDNTGWYRDFAGIWHPCPKCTVSTLEKWTCKC